MLCFHDDVFVAVDTLSRKAKQGENVTLIEWLQSGRSVFS